MLEEAPGDEVAALRLGHTHGNLLHAVEPALARNSPNLRAPDPDLALTGSSAGLAHLPERRRP
jgi:hypothetical protein